MYQPTPSSDNQIHVWFTSRFQLQDKREGATAASDADAAVDAAAATGGRAARPAKSAAQGSATAPAAAPREQQHRSLPIPTPRDVAGGDGKFAKAMASTRATDKQVAHTAASFTGKCCRLFAARAFQRRVIISHTVLRQLRAVCLRLGRPELPTQPRAAAVAAAGTSQRVIQALMLFDTAAQQGQGCHA